MSLTLYALFPDRYVPQHAVLATHTHKPDEAKAIVRSDGRKSAVVTYMDRIVRVLSKGQPMSRADIQRKAGVSKNCVRDNVLELMQQGKVVRTDGRIPLYWWVP